MGSNSGKLARRLWAAGTIAGVTAALVLVVLVFKFGRYDPSPPSLERNPNPAIPGEILFIDGDGCIVRARASGESRSRVSCPGLDTWKVSWVDQDTIARVSADRPRPGEPTWTELDLATGEEHDTGIAAGNFEGKRGAESPQGERVVIEEDGDVILVSGVERTEIASFEVPRHGQPQLVTWSPDGAWMLLTYWAQRDERRELWILSKDGQTKGTLARMTSWAPLTASWWIDGAGYLPAVDGLPAGR